MSGTLTVSGMAAGLPFGEEVVGPLTMTGANVIDQVDGTTLAVGDNPFSVPAGSIAVLIVLGTGGVAATVKVRTSANASDAGLAVTPCTGVGFAVLPIPAGVTSVILNASATAAGVSLVFI